MDVSEALIKNIAVGIVWMVVPFLWTAFITWMCFVSAAKLFKRQCGPRFPAGWWEYPFLPVFGYYCITLLFILLTVLITQNSVKDILQNLRHYGMINF